MRAVPSSELGGDGAPASILVVKEDVSSELGSPISLRQLGSESSRASLVSLEHDEIRNPFPPWLEDGSNIPQHHLRAAQNSKLSRLPTETQADFACRVWWERHCYSFKLQGAGGDVSPWHPSSPAERSPEAVVSFESRSASRRPFVIEESPTRKLRPVRVPRAKTAMSFSVEDKGEGLQDAFLLLQSGRKLWHEHDDLEGAAQMFSKALLDESADPDVKVSLETCLAEIEQFRTTRVSAAQTNSGVSANEKNRCPRWRTTWSKDFKAGGIEVDEYGRVATVVNGDCFGTIRAQDPIPVGGKTYFECRIESHSKGLGEPLGDGYLIGVCSDAFKEFERIPGRGGRFSEHMWALQDKNNGPTGLVLDRGRAQPWILGSAFGNLDAIGVLVDMERRSVTFYKNGVRCGEEACVGTPPCLYPMCTLINAGVRVRISCPGSMPEFLYAIKTQPSPQRVVKQQSRAALVLKENVVGRPLGWAAKQQITPQMLSKVLKNISPQEVFSSELFRPHTSEPRAAPSTAAGVDRRDVSSSRRARIALKSAPPLSSFENPFEALRKDSLAATMQKRQHGFLAKLQKETAVSLKIGPLGFRDRDKPTWAESLRLR